MKVPLPEGENRTPEQLRRHYEVERRLAGRAERRGLYNRLYDDLYRLAPDHPQLVNRRSDRKLEEAKRALLFLKPFLSRDSTFLEIGPGDCTLSFEVSRLTRKVYAVDVCEVMSRHDRVPENFELVLSDGCSVPVPEHSVDVAFSNQMIEHLHPEDAEEQLNGVFRALAPGGVYICLTPNRFSGPHDISRYFDPVATGFHLKEYTATELGAMFRRAGFSRALTYAEAKGRYLPIPGGFVRLIEGLLGCLPWRIQKRLARALPLRLLLGVRIVGFR